MIRKEKIEKALEFFKCIRLGYSYTDQQEYFNLIIELLSQEQCDDIVSRKQLSKALTIKWFDLNWEHTLADVLLVIDSLPPVRPKPKTGHWIHLGGGEWCCSACGKVIHTEGSWEKPKDKFCKECGAKMFEPQESEG